MEPLILIAEDDASTRTLAGAILKAAGFAVLQAGDAGAALRLLREEPGIALLFTDVIMPGMNGFALADSAVRTWPGLRVLYATTLAKLRDADSQPGLLLGRILLKPYTKTELVTAVDRTLMRPAPSRPAWRQAPSDPSTTWSVESFSNTNSLQSLGYNSIIS